MAGTMLFSSHDVPPEKKSSLVTELWTDPLKGSTFSRDLAVFLIILRLFTCTINVPTTRILYLFTGFSLKNLIHNLGGLGLTTFG